MRVRVFWVRVGVRRLCEYIVCRFVFLFFISLAGYMVFYIIILFEGVAFFG